MDAGYAYIGQREPPGAEVSLALGVHGTIQDGQGWKPGTMTTCHCPGQQYKMDVTGQEGLNPLRLLGISKLKLSSQSICREPRPSRPQFPASLHSHMNPSALLPPLAL